VRIRPAEPADARAIAEIVERAYGGYVERIGLRPGPMDDDYAEKVAAGLVWVADDAGVAGLIVLVEEPDDLLIENVAVDPRRQGEGIGRALLGFAEDSARKAGLSTLRLYTHEMMTENLALYAQLGYHEDERRREEVLDRVFERVFLSKRLG
jgi:ribosomal protein S18 acetylase RimI-like enzyme